tara:strand:- start:270 stop:764 length:495 start_codon:yes stop_codon:yes gene_type:complete
MKKILFFIILLIFVSCSQEESKDSNKIYSMDEVAVIGIKIKGDFETNFPESTDSKWGFLKGREIAIIRYPTVELALTLGKTVAEEQTELIEVVEKNIAHGPKVERKECRGHAGYGIHGNCSSRREPMYTEYIIYGNLVIMAEPLATEEPEDTLGFLQETADKLP